MCIVRRICLEVMVCSLLAALVPQGARAQAGAEDTPRDTLRPDTRSSGLPYVPPANAPRIMASDLSESVKFAPQPLPAMPRQVPRFSPGAMPVVPYYTNPSPLHRGDYSTGGIMARTGAGYFTGAGSQTSLPGIGRLNEASAGYGYRLGHRLEFQIRMNAMQMNMSHLTRRMFGTSGMLAYQASDRVGFRIFGTHVMGSAYGMSADSYGATMVLGLTDRFGIEMGVQRYYDSMRGGWQTVPVAIPYYKFDNFTLGLDVGAILYEILRTTVFDGGKRNGGPTILPPRPSLPVRRP